MSWKCEICKKEKIEYCKKRCKTCYHRIKWQNDQKELKKDPKKYEEFRLRRINMERKRNGCNVDVIYKIKPDGSGTITWAGYRRLCKRTHPNAKKNGWIMEHVYVMSEHLGRPLKKGETVHHRNGDRLDNRIENLELWSTYHGPGQRVSDKIKWCKEFLKQYENELDKLEEFL